MSFKRILIVIFFVFPLSFSSCRKEEPADVNGRLQNLKNKIEAVGNALQKSEGLAKDASRIDYEVAKLFAGYIEWELAHPEIMTQALVSDRSSARLRLNPEQKKQRFEEYIDRMEKTAIR